MGSAASDLWLEDPRGRIFARAWTPAAAGPRPGTEPPIVLLHDSLGCVELWRDFPGRLADATGRRVIAYDRLGFGRSDRRTDRLAPDFVAQEAKAGFAAVRERLGCERFVAFGHSVGGGMAINCAAEFGAECQALITESAQTFAEERTLRGIRAAQVQFEDAGQVERLARYHGEKTRWVLDAWIGTWLDPAFADWSLAGVLPRVACPVLAIHGDRDEYGSTRHPEMIGQLCGGPAQIEIMADTGHVPHRERAQAVLERVSRFVEALG